MGRTSVRHGKPRARRAVALAIAVAALGIPGGRALGGSWRTGGADAERGWAGRQTVVVRPGDTLWGIASAIVGPAGDPRPLVDAMIRANGVDPGAIRPGQVLEVPAP